jgi:hypothetical protein
MEEVSLCLCMEEDCLDKEEVQEMDMEVDCEGLVADKLLDSMLV